MPAGFVVLHTGSRVMHNIAWLLPTYQSNYHLRNVQASVCRTGSPAGLRRSSGALLKQQDVFLPAAASASLRVS